MGASYHQFSLEERCDLARLRADGRSIRQIAATLGRAPSSVSRELRRNSGPHIGYKPVHADDLNWARRWRGPRLVRQPALYQLVVSKLVMGWSPEQMINLSLSADFGTEDHRFLQEAQRIGGQIRSAFERGLANGQISEADLFDKNYQPVSSTNPQQYMARFTLFTDRMLPEFQEPALKFSERVVFCAAVDTNGYLPAHNLKFSQPQTKDPVWNASNCRNRRIFNDRVGLAAGQSTAPYLLQLYRRDMGGGKFAMMKDLSVPITINSRHWGGLRLAYLA